MAKTINPAYIEKVNQLVNRCPYFDLLSMKLVEVGAGFSELEIDLAQIHLKSIVIRVKSNSVDLGQ